MRLRRKMSDCDFIIIIKMYFRIFKYFEHALTKLDFHYSDKFMYADNL
jgi:hypothetical protein